MLQNVTVVYVISPSRCEIEARVDGVEWTTEPVGDPQQIKMWRDLVHELLDAYAPGLEENLSAEVLGITDDGRVRFHVEDGEDQGEQ